MPWRKVVKNVLVKLKRDFVVSDVRFIHTSCARMYFSDTVSIEKDLDGLAVNNFREYLRIPSVHPNINYTPCIEFLKRQSDSIGLHFKTVTCVTGKPIAVLTLPGTDPELPSVLLNSHMDVVPVFEDKWTYKPFDAHMDENGNIYGRGAQDMKCVGIQYLEAVRRLKLNGIQLKRTLHISFVPDEEIGGQQGMKLFVETNDFDELNVGVALDEGVASSSDVFSLFYGERTAWRITIHCSGQPGHGSLLLGNTAGEKVANLLKTIYEFRSQQIQKLEDHPDLTIGDVTTLNLTRIEGGVQSNVIPTELMLIFDCRIPVTVDLIKWEETLNWWCAEAGTGVWIEFSQKRPHIPVTKLDDLNPFWVAYEMALNEMKLKIRKQIFTGATDSRHIRAKGIPAIGFSPMNNTPVLLHDNDEFLNSKIFLRGIDIYYKIIEAVANV